MDRKEFIKLVEQAVEALPTEFVERIENVTVVVEDEPSVEQRRRADVAPGMVLLGLYEGVPLTNRPGYQVMLPDKITVFQKAIESSFQNRERIITEIQRVVRHEIAHHFGIDDKRLEELGI